MKPVLLQITEEPGINYGKKVGGDGTPHGAYVAFFITLVCIFIFVGWGLKKLGKGK